MRHVPDDELHAYLDQALSRSQCIEIETHLAECARCRDDRDAIAALRDRTTALLAGTAPRVTAPPPLPTLLARAEAKRRTSWRRRAMLAASFGGAIFAGWGMRAALDPHQNSAAGQPLVQTEPTQTTLPTPDDPAFTPPNVRTQVPSAPSSPSTTPVRLAATGVAATEETGHPTSPAHVTLVLDEGWRAVDPAEVESIVAGMLPAYPGLPVTDVRIRAIGPGERPVLIVSQAHESGTVLYTVEGPAERVAEVVAAQLAAAPEGFRSSDPSRTPPDYLETPTGYRRTRRVLAVLGSLPLDTLNAIAQRVTLR